VAIRPPPSVAAAADERRADVSGEMDLTDGITRPRMALLLALLGLIAALALGPAATRGEAAQCAAANTPAYKLSREAARKATLCAINVERRHHHLGRLRFDRHQQKAASRHNRVMVEKRCFSHQCSGERDLVGRFISAGYLPCNCYWGVAENIAYGSGDTSTPHSIVNAWMNSALHRINILNPRYDEAGIGVNRGTPEGGGDAATFTMDFGYKG
jgi:uncharacterized protein YkwD